MKKILLLCTTLTFLLIPRLFAKDPQVLFYHASFFSPLEGPYVETYLKVFGASTEYVKTPSGMFQASLEITLLFKKEDKIVDFRKYNLLSNEIADTAGGMPNFIDQQRVLLPKGIYQFELLLKDNNSKAAPVTHSDELVMEFNDKDLKFSDFQIVESFKPTQKENILSKSGFDLVPYVGNFFPAGATSLTFYAELYNLDKKIGNQEVFLYKYYLESSETNLSLRDYSKFQRQKATAINPLLATLPITDLPSGKYNLVIEARDKNNELIELNKILFERSNPGVQINMADLSTVDIKSTFVEKITSADSLQFYILSLIPVANMHESKFAKNVTNIQDVSQMQKFLYSFWRVRNENNPEAEWNRHREMAIMVDNAFKTKIRHGFETDQGRVMMKYGVPDDVIDSKSEPSTLPYTIWHYYHIGDQNNRIFVFSNPHLVGTEYILLHSTANGEIFNAEWATSIMEKKPLQTSGVGNHFFENINR